MADTASGRVVTFYSYKGGTGRSMALANIAWLLALSGHRVLTIDWDLEAPGLHRYFHPFMSDPSQTATEGLLDFALGIADIASADPELGARTPEYFAQHARLDTFIEPLDCDFLPRGAELGFIGPGRQGPAYSQQLGLFNWHQFYSKLQGRHFLDAAIARLRLQYDYILIDSRTGVSDTAGICTVHLPDVLVVCFTLNDQSIRGASGVAEHVRAQRADDELNKKFRVLPVASRVEIVSEHDKRQTALAYARQAFSSCFPGMSERQQDTYWGQTQLVYLPFYAFEEIPAVFGDDPRAEFSLMTPVRRLAAHITGSEIPEPALDAAERKSALQGYLRSTERTVMTAAESLVEHSSSQQVDALQSVLLRLVRVEGGMPSLRHAPTRTLPPGTETALKDLHQAGVVILSRDGSGEQHASLSDDTLLKEWPRLTAWIREDFAFLIRRQEIDAATEAWRRAEKDEGALLRGARLVDASELARSRPRDLNEREREFIEVSRHVENRGDVEAETNHSLSLLHVRLVTLSTVGALAAVLLLAVTLYAVFRVSVETIARVETAATLRVEAQRLPVTLLRQGLLPAVVATGQAAVRAMPAGQSADQKAIVRRERRKSGLGNVVSRINLVSIAGLPYLPSVSLNTAFLFASAVGAGLPMLLILTIVVTRHLIAWQATQPLRHALEQPTQDNGSTAYAFNLIVRRLDAMVRAYRYPDALGTPVIGGPSLVARLAMLCIAATSIYVTVLTILVWRGRGLSLIPPVTAGVFAAIAVAAAWFYSRGSSSVSRLVSDLSSFARVA